MTSVLFCNIHRLGDKEISEYLQLLPEFMRDEILKYKLLSDQKARLISRLMLLYTLKRDGAEGYLPNWIRDSNRKPYIPRWKYFNISHSGELVTFISGKSKVGIDIERNLDINYMELLPYLHAQEQYKIVNSKIRRLNFYHIWVKKEAFLKTIGIGLLNGLSEYSCVGDNIVYDGINYKLKEISISCDYISYICVQRESDQVEITQFDLNNLGFNS
jgi:4'-phosphopantetheinyl transferase